VFGQSATEPISVYSPEIVGLAVHQRDRDPLPIQVRELWVVEYRVFNE
jgi:hypothetical protein